MKHKDEKPTQSVATAARPLNGSQTSVTPKAEKEAAKTEQKEALSPIDKILNDLEVLNARKEDREQLLETWRKLKSFNPTVTEAGCYLTIKDKTHQFQTSATEPLKMILGHYIAIVEHKLKEVEADISHLASRLAGL